MTRADAGFAMVAAAVYRTGRMSKQDGTFFEPADFNPWVDRKPITLEEAMRTWK
jgi:hypothetical protein